MDRLLSLHVFREIVETGSFTVTADRLGVSAPMVSKHVAQLERRLRTRLLHRSSRHVSLTEAGEVYYAQCRKALDALDAGESALTQNAAAPRGQLKVSAPVWCANRDFARTLAGFRHRYPDVVVDMRLENRRVDLETEGFDLALRATANPAPNLVATPLFKVEFFLVGAAEYLRAVVPPLSPSDLGRLSAIEPSYINLGTLSMQGPTGKVPVRLNAVMRSDDTNLSYQAALAGVGVAFLPDRLIAEDLAAKRLIRVLPEYSVPGITLYAVHAGRRYVTAKVRCFIDFLRVELSDPRPRPSR